MADYMRKHAEHLKLGHKLRQMWAVLPLAATLTVTACSGSGENKSEKREYGLLAHDSIREHDYFGNSVTLKHVSINLYKDKKMTPSGISQMRWGTPKEEMSNIYRGEKTFAKKVRYGGEEDMAYIEVFENEFGVLISKDQPCFIVDTHNTLVYFGDQDTFLSNMSRYVKENNLYKIDYKSTRNIDKREALPMIEATDSAFIDTLMNDIKDVPVDSILKEIDGSNSNAVKNNDSLSNDAINIDTLLIKKENQSKE